MPSSRFLIASNTLSSLAASVTFSSIPATYTDLVLRYSYRDNNNGVVQAFATINFNGSSSAVYSSTNLRNNNGNTVTSIRQTNSTYIEQYPAGSGSSATANTFGSAELYIPNYGSTSNIPFSSIGFAETNNTTIEAEGIVAGLWRGSAAITSITLTAETNFVSGSSFFLYGLKNS